MNQAFHIFRKDVRHFWPHIAVLMTLTAGAAWLGAKWPPVYHFQWPASRDAYGLFTMPLVIAWWFVIAAVIHDEVLVGDRQFWITRPYSWKTLLAAKVLFAVVFVHLPFLVSDCVILSAQGFSPASMLSFLLSRQFLLPFSLVLPAAVLAALTRGLRQFVMAGFLLFVAMVLFWEPGSIFREPNWGELSWVRDAGQKAIFFLPILAAMVWQYARRRTIATRLVSLAGAGASVALAFLPMGSLAFAIESRILPDSDQYSKVAVVFAPERAVQGSAFHRMHIPIRIIGIPENMVEVDRWDVALAKAPTGSPLWHLFAPGARWLDWLDADLNEHLYQRLAAGLVNVHASFDLVIFGAPSSVKVSPARRDVPVPGFGFVSLRGGRRGPLLIWHTPLRYGSQKFVCGEWSGVATLFPPSTMRQRSIVESRSGTSSGANYNGDWPASGISPVVEFVHPLEPGVTDVEFTAARPVAYIRREMEIRNLNLADYVDKRP